MSGVEAQPTNRRLGIMTSIPCIYRPMLYIPHIRRLKLGIFAGFNARNVESCNRPTIGIGAAYEWVLAKRPGEPTHSFAKFLQKKYIHHWD